MIGRCDGLLSTGPLGGATALLGDRDVLYAGVAAVTGLPEPGPVTDHDSALRRTLRRVDLDHCLVTGAATVGFAGARGDTDAVRLAVPGNGWLVDLTGGAAAQQAYAEFLFDVNRRHGLETGPATINDLTVDRVRRALAVVGELLPGVAETTFPFVHHYVVLNMGPASMNIPQLPESLFVAPELMDADVLRLADAALHEALHEKMAVLRLTRFLMRPGYDDDSSATFLLPWSLRQPSPRRFNAGRIVSAAHVYTHLAVLYGVVLSGGSPAEAPPPDTVAARLVEAYERAACLLDATALDPLRHEYGEDGRALVATLREALELVRVQHGDRLPLVAHRWPELSPAEVVTEGSWMS